MNTTKKIIAILMVGIVAMAAVGVPIAIGDDLSAGTEVEKVSPVVNSIAFYEWDGDSWELIGDSGLALAPYTDATTAAETPIRIVANVTCLNGHDDIGSVTASFGEPLASGYVGSLTLTYVTNNDYATGDTLKLKSWVTRGNHDVTVTAPHKYQVEGVPADGTLTVPLKVAPTKAILISGGPLAFETAEEGALTPGDPSETATVQVTSLGNDAIAGLTVEPGVMTKVGGDDTFNGATAIKSLPDSQWADISIDACTSSGTSDEDLSFVLTIPLGTPAGSYTGTIGITPA